MLSLTDKSSKFLNSSIPLITITMSSENRLKMFLFQTISARWNKMENVSFMCICAHSYPSWATSFFWTTANDLNEQIFALRWKFEKFSEFSSIRFSNLRFWFPSNLCKFEIIYQLCYVLENSHNVSIFHRSAEISSLTSRTVLHKSPIDNIYFALSNQVFPDIYFSINFQQIAVHEQNTSFFHIIGCP